jgi:hypothetical protein
MVGITGGPAAPHRVWSTHLVLFPYCAGAIDPVTLSAYCQGHSSYKPQILWLDECSFPRSRTIRRRRERMRN